MKSGVRSLEFGKDLFLDKGLFLIDLEEYPSK